MALNFEYFSASDDTVAAGVFIQVTDLWNVQSGELEGSQADRESRVMFGLLEVLANPNGPLNDIENKLGLLSTYPNPVGVGTNLVNQTYNLTALYHADLSSGSIAPLPVPTVGTFDGIGGVSVVDVFPNVTELSPVDSTGGAGILIPSALLEAYGGPAHAAIITSIDSRSWFAALFLYMADNATIRSASVASAVVATNPVVAAIGALPSGAQIAATNATTGLDPADQVTNMVLTRTVNLTMQKLIDTQTETVQPNHVTA